VKLRFGWNNLSTRPLISIALKINNMIKYFLILLFAIPLFSCKGKTSGERSISNNNRDTLLVIRNDLVSLTVSRFGGAIIGFTFNDFPLNPFTWKLTNIDMPENNRKGAPFRGHFLCIGRWGKATKGEIASGIPSNGEPSNTWWKQETPENQYIIDMHTYAPIEQLEVNRIITLSANQSCFTVAETLTNLQKNGRFTAIVQHATIGTPFLDENTIISSDATFGFNQSLALYSLSKYEYRWPYGFSDSLKTIVDLTKSDIKEGYVSTHIIEDEYGWVTAANPENGLLVGYLWRTSDYPWFHIWHGLKEGKLWAKGLEFGTTGLGDTFTPDKRATITFHGVNNNQFLDARSSITKKYFCFLIKIPKSFRETDSVFYNNGIITVKYLTDKEKLETVFEVNIW